KFITYDDRAVATYAIRSADKQPHRVTLEVVAPYPPIPASNGTPLYPLLGRFPDDSTGRTTVVSGRGHTPAGATRPTSTARKAR
ncbi:MAG: hypothetical protein L0221_19685, partial [Chloroflexi bacterium]|nr:hypothetical protein [Chloroflexota bacterium]